MTLNKISDDYVYVVAIIVKFVLAILLIILGFKYINVEYKGLLFFSLALAEILLIVGILDSIENTKLKKELKKFKGEK